MIVISGRQRATLAILLITALALLLCGCNSGTIGARVIVSPDAFVQRAALPYKVKWVKDLGSGERYIDDTPFERSVPLVVDETIYVGSTAEIFTALNARTSNLIWQFQPEGAVESTAAVDSDKVYFGDSNGKIYALNRDYGDLVWSYRTKGEILSKLTVSNDVVYAATSFNRVLALNANSGELLWLADHDPADDFTIRGVSSPLVTKNAIYAGYADGSLAAIDPATGKELWSNTLKRGQRFIDVDATPILHKGRLYVPSFDGKLYCLEADTGTIVWSFEHGGVSRVAIHNGRIFFSSDDNQFYAVSLQNGELIWSFNVKADYELDSIYKSKRSRNQIPGQAAIVNDVVVFASMSGYVYALDMQSGVKRWTYLPGEGVTSGVVAYKDRLYFLSNAGKLYCLRQSGPPQGY
ncbi:MAG: PQQ-binding-like beta-propeller repeat protein [Candidatus Alcyoniella australis]|nr:PQQ-binding-like beta-propeller repeat protein [Candidatus Alcyoniella australis]